MALHLDLDEEPVNTTPMIDVVFNLLVFFMLSATFMSEEQELDVQLPRVSAAAPLTEAPSELAVNVLADGKVVVRGKEIAPDDLVAMLKKAIATYPDQVVAVRGHRRTPYERVLRVYALARQAGVAKVVARVMEES